MSELLLATHINPFNGLAYAALAQVDPEEDPGSSRCLVLKEYHEATMARVMVDVCKDEEDNIPEEVDTTYIEVDSTTSINLEEVKIVTSLALQEKSSLLLSNTL